MAELLASMYVLMIVLSAYILILYVPRAVKHAPFSHSSGFLILGIVLHWAGIFINSIWFSAARIIRELGLEYVWMSTHWAVIVGLLFSFMGALIHIYAATKLVIKENPLFAFILAIPPTVITGAIYWILINL